MIVPRSHCSYIPYYNYIPHFTSLINISHRYKKASANSGPDLSQSLVGPPFPMSSPPRTPEDGRRAENIKQYYQQLCANYRLISQQLQNPELLPAKRSTLQGQLDKLQLALQDFTDKVIKPIINANKSNSPRRLATPMVNAGTPQAPVMPAGVKPLRTGFTVGLATQQFLDQTRLSEGVLVERGPNSRGRTTGTQTGAGGSMTLTDLFPGTKFSQAAEEFLLEAADRYLSTVCRGVCESARHRKRPGISMRDFELVIGREMGMTRTTAAVPSAAAPSVPVKGSKKSTSSNPHNSRMQQLRKHTIQL